MNWREADQELVDFVARLSEFRRNHPCLRQNNFLHGNNRDSDGLPDVEWSDFNGEPLRWRDPGLSNLCLTLRASAATAISSSVEQADDTVFIVFNRDVLDADVSLPKIRDGHHWVRAIDTAAADIFAVCECDGSTMKVAGHSVVAAVSQSNEPM